MISPMSIVVYIVAVVLFVKYYPKKNKEGRCEQRDLWTRYWNLADGLFTDTIHHSGPTTLNSMKNILRDVQKIKETHRKDDCRFTDLLSVVFNTGFIMNCVFFANNFTASNIIIYVQYTHLIKNSVSMCINVFNQYKDAKREYAKLEEKISGSSKRGDITQIENYFKFSLKNLEYTYPLSEHSTIPFKLYMEKEKLYEFELGQIVILTGNSGHGKSTFCDIINGIIPNQEYSYDFLLNGFSTPDGFDCLTGSRYYNEQQESIHWKLSVYEIITQLRVKLIDGKLPIDYDVKNEHVVWKAITICSCCDFMKRDNVEDDLKWIYSENIGLSGGQELHLQGQYTE